MFVVKTQYGAPASARLQHHLSLKTLDLIGLVRGKKLMSELGKYMRNKKETKILAKIGDVQVWDGFQKVRNAA